MTLLVTGPTGNAGQYIVENLMALDEDVRVLSLPDSMHRVPFRNRLDMVPGSLDDPIALAEAIDGVDVVYHAATIAPPPFRQPEEMRHVNVLGTRRLAEACAGRVRRLVFVSTNNVYLPHPTQPTWPVREGAPRLAHGNPQKSAHGQSMIDAEDAIFEAHARWGLEYCILRPAVICGRGARFLDSMVGGLLRQPETAFVLHAQNGQMQWLHGNDFGKACILAGTMAQAANEIFLLAGNEPVTAFDVLEMLYGIINPNETENPYTETAKQYRTNMCKFDISKAMAQLNWTPEIPVSHCLKEILGRIEFYTSISLNLPKELLDA
jgi:nucleoside-diphosphate-sugar epimerase